MPTLSLHRLAALLTGAILCLSASAQDERWYQVELLVFSNENSFGTEQWEPLPSLTYPDSGRFLIFPETNRARVEEYRARASALSADTAEREFEVESETDEFGRQFIRILPVAVDEAPDIPLATPPAGEEPPPGDPQVAVDPNAPAFEEPPLYPTPFVALPPSSREFYGKAAYMQRTGEYRTLFHETWIQPVLEEERAIPLILDRSGDDQAWPRLQGSIKLHLSRYLHIEANLWLNTRGDYLPEHWRMPPPPLGPVSVIVEEPEPEQQVLEEEEPVLLEEEEAAELEEEEQAEPEGPVYPWRHAVLLHQKRKMRSNEVHYIDHPLLGVVVKLTPLDEEQLQLLAEAEQASLESNSPDPSGSRRRQ